MNRKLRVIILTMVLTVLMFGGTRLMAQDNLDVNTTEASQTTPNEGKVEPMANGEEVTSSVETDKNTDIDGNEANDEEETGETVTTEPKDKEDENTEVNKTEKTEGEPKAKQEEKTEAPKQEEKKSEAKKDAKEADKPAEKTAEGNKPEDGAKLQAAPAKAPAPVGEGNGNGTGNGEGVDNGEPTKPVVEKDQIDKSADEELKALQEQIDAANDAKDAKKVAELQKQYNEKYFKKLEAAGADKYADDTAKRLKNKDEIALYNEIKEKKQELDAKLAEGKLTQKDVDDFNKLLGGFTPPRALTEKESEAAQKVGQEPYYPGLSGESEKKYEAYLNAKKASDANPDDKELKDALTAAENNLGEGEKAWRDYKEAKEALEKALNADKPTSDEEISRLLNTFNSTIGPLKEAINNDKLDLSYAKKDGKPEVYIFPIGDDGRVDPRFGYGDKPNDWQKEDTYYIPDDAEVKLIVQVNRNNEDKAKDFKFIIRPENIGEFDPDVKLEPTKEIAYINGNPIELQPNSDGSYTFTVKSGEDNFGIAQLTLKTSKFSAPFHNGFELTMENYNGDELVESKTKKFLITKKGYEDNADLNGPGLKKPSDEEPAAGEEVPEINAGTTENGIVVENTKELQDFFVELEKAHGYIDKEILVNSANGKSLPLSSVDITITLPKYDKRFAEYIYKSGLKYEKLEGEGQEGKYRLKLDVKAIGGHLEKADGAQKYPLKNVILVDKDGNKVYVDQNGKLLRENPSDESSDPVKVEEREVLTGEIGGSKTKYKIVGDKLTLGEGEAAKEAVKVNGKDNTWTLTEGSITTTYKLEGDKLISYTDIKDVYEGNVSNENEKANKEVTPTFEGTQIVVEKDGTKSYGGTIIKDGIFKVIKDSTGKIIDRKYVNAKPKELGWGEKIPEGYEKYEKEKEYVLIDKFGLLMGDITVKKDGEKYTFTKGKDIRTATKAGETTKDGLTISISDKKRLYVDNKNIIQSEDNREAIIGKYYYDGKFNDGKFIKADKGVFGDKIYLGYSDSKVKREKEYYNTKTDGAITTEDKPGTLYGSNNPDDYYTIEGKTYYKENVGTDEEPEYRYIYAEVKDSADIISKDVVYKIVQTIGENQIITKETNIFDAVRNAEFRLRFPGFLASKDMQYDIQADVKASYFDPLEKKEKSIFGSDSEEAKKYRKTEGEEVTYSFKKYFTIRLNEKGLGFFFKKSPEEFKNLPDYNLFNIIYRDSSDRQRDDFIKALVELREKHNPETETDKEKAKKIKEQIEFLEKLEKSLDKLYGKSGLKFAKDGENLVIKDGKENFEVKRSLLWEVGFNNEKGILFPIDVDTQITIDDYNLDNRLVYDEIIINNTRKTWEDTKKAKEANNEKFEGTGEYFFLDQIDNIILGVNPNAANKKDFELAGEKFIISGDELRNAVNNGDNEIVKDGIKYQIIIDKDKAQIRIKVLNAFYNKDFRTDGYKSPVQKGYEESLEALAKEAENFKFEGDDTNALKNQFETLVGKVYPEKTYCYNTLTQKFYELLNAKTGNARTEFLNKVLDDIKKSNDTAKLKYLDSKDDYKYDDMRYNAIRVLLKPNIQIGGPLDVSKIKKIGISSVLVPEVDIPYTDEFGRPLTNKAVADNDPKVLIKVKDKDGNLVAEDTIKDEVLRKAGDDFEFFYTKDDIPYYIYSAKLGKDLDFTDLAIKGEDDKYKALLDKNGNQINKYYVKSSESVDPGPRVDLKSIKDEKVKAIVAEIINSPIDLYSYYIHEQGPARGFYENKASYKLGKFGQGPRIFGNEDDWKYKICGEVGIGSCLVKEGGSSGETVKPTKDLIGTDGDAENKITLDYTPSNPGPDEENPKFDKTNPNPDKKDININESKDMNVDFKIDTRVDKLKKEEQEAKNILIEDKKEKEKADKKLEEDVRKGYYDEDGYFVYKNSFIIDVLPDIFQITKDTKINLTFNKDALTANGANKDFADDEKLEAFRKKAKYIYVEDVYDYLSKITDEDQRKAFEEAIEEKGIKKGQRAIIVKLPKFQAPHGSADSQFTVEIKNLLVDRKKYKEAEAKNNNGQIYTNHGLFSGEGTILYDNENTTVTDGHKGSVNKYLRVVNEKGEPVSDEELGNWFKGNVELKFGDKFDYKIKVRKTNNLVDTGFGNSTNLTEWKMTDKLPGNVNGLRPILRDFVKVPDNLKVLYKINGNEYTEDDIKAGKAKLSDVTEITFTLKEGRTFKVDEDVSFEIPMEILDMDAKIEGGKIKYIGTDGKEVVEDADKFFKLGDFKEKDKDLYGENSVEDSNEVRVYLEKQKFVKIFKEFFDSEGKRITEGLPDELEFIITDENGKSETIILKKENNFEGKSGYLPWFKKTVTFDEDGNAKVDEEEIKYNFTLKEKDSKGYILEVENISEDEYKIAIAFKAKNTEPEKPEYPGEEPKKETITITVNKVWDTKKEGELPSITVVLYANGKATDKTITLSAANGWSASFENLDAKDADDKEIDYSVREVGETNGIYKLGDREFKVTISGNAKDGFTITNTEEPEKPEEPNDENPKEKEDKDKHKSKEDDDKDRDLDQGKNKLPKTGVAEDLASIYFAFVLLLGLVFIKKRYLVK